MEIVVRGRTLEDFPDVGVETSGLVYAVEKVIRRRLQLRPQDRIVVELRTD